MTGEISIMNFTSIKIANKKGKKTGETKAGIISVQSRCKVHRKE